MFTKSTLRPKSLRWKATSRTARRPRALLHALETLADHDDELMEQLLEDIQPPRDKVFSTISRANCATGRLPGAFGNRGARYGMLRLLKALRHESPGIAETAKRLGVKGGADAVAYVLETQNTTDGGRMSIARTLAGQAGDGTTFL